MNLKLRAEISVRVDVKQGMEMGDIKTLVMKHCTEGKFMLNRVVFDANFEDEAQQKTYEKREKEGMGRSLE